MWVSPFLEVFYFFSTHLTHSVKDLPYTYSGPVFSGRLALFMTCESEYEAQALGQNMKKNSKKGKNSPTLTPHDGIFRIVFEDLEKAKDFIQAIFPEEILEKLDLTTLVKEPDTFSNPSMGNFRADVIYSCNFGAQDKVWVTFLLEHKSFIPQNPYLQLIEYKNGIWKGQQRNKKPLSPIIPIIFYHGEKEWKARDFPAYFEGGGIDQVLMDFVPNFKYWLVNLGPNGDDRFMEKVTLTSLRVILLLMQQIHTKKY